MPQHPISTRTLGLILMMLALLAFASLLQAQMSPEDQQATIDAMVQNLLLQTAIAEQQGFDATQALEDAMANALTATAYFAETQAAEARQQAIQATQQAEVSAATQQAEASAATQQAELSAATQRAEEMADPNRFNGGNSDWVPQEEKFGNVTMVLVPRGCFMMGTDDIYDDEEPLHEQCFDEPFWIDKFEVTNEQYGSTGCVSSSPSDEHPRNCVSWFDAYNFCEAHGGRLPTEAEWEYAARGPDSLMFPWGNSFIDLNTVYGGNSTQAAVVGSRPSGASWVGAMDMSGNLWEWTSSLYLDYPYDADDGREDESELNLSRVWRGGAWNQGVLESMRLPARFHYGPDVANFLIGFRCVRDYDQP